MTCSSIPTASTAEPCSAFRKPTATFSRPRKELQADLTGFGVGVWRRPCYSPAPNRVTRLRGRLKETGLSRPSLRFLDHARRDLILSPKQEGFRGKGRECSAFRGRSGGTRSTTLPGSRPRVVGGCRPRSAPAGPAGAGAHRNVSVYAAQGEALPVAATLATGGSKQVPEEML